MEAQGYSIDSDTLFQYNQSTIMLANNCRSSSRKKSKHIKNCYLLITDKIHQEYMEIRYKPTGDMLDDYE